jgi:N-acetylglucosaminyldiphosphoundecaprenol N-acetyl-beta-D-mannosaminyltransferase
VSLRILVATAQWFPDFHGGSARFAAETSRRLAAWGHEVTVLAPQAAGRPAEERHGQLTLLRALPRTVLPESLLDIVASRRAAKRLGESRFDVVVAHHATVAVGVAGAHPDVPLLLVYQASPAKEARFVGRRSLRALALTPYLALVERRAVRRADRIVVLSEFSRSLLARHRGAGEKALVVPGGVDVDRFSPGDRATARMRVGVTPSDELIFTVRRLDPRMGLEALLGATASLIRDRARLRLAIAGTGPLEGRLRRVVADLGLDSRVTLLGRVDETELVDWYRAADVLALPTEAYEGFGLVTAEALACGTPVVGTPVGATPELLGPLDEGLIAKGWDAPALASALAVALDRGGADQRRRCRDYAAARFGWDGVLDLWERALADATHLRPRRVEILGAPIDSVTLREAVDIVDERIRAGRPTLHASLNAAKLVRLRRDDELARAIAACDLVTADGQPVVWTARLAGHRIPERVAGIDLMEALLARAADRGFRIFLLGGRQDVLEDAEAEIRRRHPTIRVVGRRNGYFDPKDEPTVVDAIRSARPDIVFIALGTPQKELFQDRHRSLEVPFMMGVGGALDVLAGRTRRAPAWARRGGLEWAFRLVQEPRRLLSRYLVGNAVYVALAGREIVRIRLGRMATGRTTR